MLTHGFSASVHGSKLEASFLLGFVVFILGFYPLIVNKIFLSSKNNQISSNIATDIWIVAAPV